MRDPPLKADRSCNARSPSMNDSALQEIAIFDCNKLSRVKSNIRISNLLCLIYENFNFNQSFRELYELLYMYVKFYMEK